MVKISASLLEEGFFQDVVDKVKSADMIHFDVMDGEFVPRKTIWTEEVASVDTKLLKDVHLMVLQPEDFIQDFIDAGADMISFHIEATDVPEAIIGMIQHQSVKAGITIKPKTDVSEIVRFLPDIDFVLIMSVEPGLGGQSFIKDSLEKVRFIRKNYPDLDIEIDGGINEETAKLAVKAGVTILVSGTYLFKDPENRINLLKNMEKKN
ncbi:ribulose-phosphate 3-epimerase [archaeon]|nr:ribulose-phosphate 3-epimerase [archaeon]MBL7057297.1 ribulose-phosphate 3-epimerase [Candidatus Woesearchaeota archaeon]